MYGPSSIDPDPLVAHGCSIEHKKADVRATAGWLAGVWYDISKRNPGWWAPWVVGGNKLYHLGVWSGHPLVI